MIVVSLVTRPDPDSVLNSFYAKMRTEVVPGDPAADAEEVQRSLDDPHRYDHKLLLPGSSFELYKWNRIDWIGFILSVAGVGGGTGLCLGVGEDGEGDPAQVTPLKRRGGFKRNAAHACLNRSLHCVFGFGRDDVIHDRCGMVISKACPEQCRRERSDWLVPP